MSFIEDLKHLVERGEDLPTLPDVVFQLHAALDNEMTSDAEVAQIIDRDPALTTRLIRVANSAFVSRGTDRVVSVTAAIQRLGLRQMRALCLALSVVKCFSGKNGGLDHRNFWTHSAAVGLVAQILWRHVRERAVVGADDVYIAGLLHDVGILILDQFFQERFRETLDVTDLSGDPLWKGEELVLGMDHGEIGALLLGRWSFPAAIVDAVGAHHHPPTASEEHQMAARIVHAAETICTAHGLGTPVEGPPEDSANEALEQLGLTGETHQDVFAELGEVSESARQFLAAA